MPFDPAQKLVVDGVTLYVPPPRPAAPRRAAPGKPATTGKPTTAVDDKEETPLYKNPLVIVGVLAVVVILYMVMTRPPAY
jgi:hypothetical protein